MAKKTDPKIKEAVLKQVEKLYDKHGAKFFDALEDSSKKTLNMNFVATIDLSEPAPVVTVQISFTDKTTEAGMNVNKNFNATLTEELDDPSQPALPGADKKGRKGDKPEGE